MMTAKDTGLSALSGIDEFGDLNGRRVERLRSHASAYHTIVRRSSKFGSPTRRPANPTLKSTPDTRFTVSITSSTEKPRP
jgi:hypothetical protein